MKNEHTSALDDGQPLVEFAPLKPAEFIVPMVPGPRALNRQSEWKYVPVRRFS